VSGPQPLTERLACEIVIFDGAMGTELYNRNVQVHRCFEELNLSSPDLIGQVHADYAQAGADVLTTNTFGANRAALGPFGLLDQLEAINRAGVELARDAAQRADGRQVLVAGSIGPVMARKDGHEDETMRACYEEQARVLIDAGADFILFESQRTRAALEACAAAMRAVDGVPFVLSAVVHPDLESMAGEPVERMVAPLPGGLPEPVARGLNCGVGPSDLLEAARRAAAATAQPLVVYPNAGMPRDVGGRQIYMCSPDYFAGFAKRFLDVGVRGIGGCCGTGPDHIREMAQRIKPLARGQRKQASFAVPAEVEPEEETPFEDKSRLAWKLSQGKWVTTVEVLPPRGYDLADTIAKAKRLYRHGVDALNLPDGPRASSRLSPLIAALRVQQDAQIEPVIHFCSRDRNLIGMQADLLACAACDIRNILFVTGDPPKLGNYPFASGVFDVDSIGLCRVQKRLNQGIDLGGQRVPKTHAVIGVGADPTMPDQERELRRFREKAEAGAEFAITQPVFDPDALLRFLDQVQDLGVPMLAGVWPLASLRNASFLQNEVPGVTIPDAVMDRMAGRDSKDDQRREGVAIAREMVERLRGRIAGVQVSAPFGNVDTALAVVA
jgi:homocysteine S-methyltransferase